MGHNGHKCLDPFLSVGKANFEMQTFLQSCKPKAATKVVSQEREDLQQSLKLPTECLYAALEDGYGS